MIYVYARIVFYQKFTIWDINAVGTVWTAKTAKIEQNIAVCEIIMKMLVKKGGAENG